MKYVIVDEEMGVYLGECFGLGFWSKLDAAGQISAPVFDTDNKQHEIVFEEINQCCGQTHQMRKVEVGTSQNYATHEDCVAAGIEPWLRTQSMV